MTLQQAIDLKRQGRYDDAIQLIQESRDVLDNGARFFALGKLYYLKSEFASAICYYMRTIHTEFNFLNKGKLKYRLNQGFSNKDEIYGNLRKNGIPKAGLAVLQDNNTIRHLGHALIDGEDIVRDRFKIDVNLIAAYVRILKGGSASVEGEYLSRLDELDQKIYFPAGQGHVRMFLRWDQVDSPPEELYGN